ncbi:MAG: hypothetical protein KIS94_12260 [Chitinophagales bacterium]|nr:hypothetical protein [Chitinophagales bacterium]
MAANRSITICGTHLSVTEAEMVAYVMLGLNYKQVSDCLGLEYGTVKNKMHFLESACNAHSLNLFMRKAFESGFDFKGCYKGTAILTERHYRLAKRYAPQVPVA